MKHWFIGGDVYLNYDRATNTFSDYQFNINKRIELDVTLLHKWPVEGGMENAWQINDDVGGTGDVLGYIHSGVKDGSAEPDDVGLSPGAGGFFGLGKYKERWWWYWAIALIVWIIYRLTKNKKK